MLHKPEDQLPYCYVEINTPKRMMFGIIPQLIVDEVFFPFTWDSKLGRDAGIVRLVELDDDFDVIEFNSGEISHYLRRFKIPEDVKYWAIQAIRSAGYPSPTLSGDERYRGWDCMDNGEDVKIDKVCGMFESECEADGMSGMVKMVSRIECMV